jgi:hypothetical protein
MSLGMYYSTYGVLSFSLVPSDAHIPACGSISYVCYSHLRAFSSPLTLPVNLIALVIYDYGLTLNREIDYIWLSKWSLIKVTFLVQRYLPFLDLILLGAICAFIVRVQGLLSHSSKVFVPHDSAQSCGHLIGLSLGKHTVTAIFLP